MGVLRVGIWMLVLLPFIGHAQSDASMDDDRRFAFDQIIELVSENLESEDLDFTTLLEDLNYFYDHPINLNHADRDELRRLVLLSELQVEAILRHRNISGKIMTELELQGVEGLDMETIQAILPFVKVSGGMEDRRITWASIKKESTHEAFVRYQRVLEQMEGYAPISDSALTERPNSRYNGSPDRIYSRYRFRYLKNISAGITMEKDAGETFVVPNNFSGFDFYSAHLYIGDIGVVKQAIVGDYQAQFGQGLTFWSGLAFGKSSSITSIKRTPRGITPYVSADENNFLRGAAATIELGDFEVTSFYSQKRVDANITGLDSGVSANEIRVTEFSSFQLSGIHGTEAQLEDKDAVLEMNTGSHIRYERGAFEVGVTGVYSKYGANYSPSLPVYRKFEPSSEEFFLGGFDYQFIYKNILVFGENALRHDGGTAFLNGAILSLDRAIDFSLLHRNYSSNYVSPKSNAIAEGSRNTNESGLYLGSAMKFGSKWRLSGYFDMFYFPWLSYRSDAPSEGKEYLAQLEYRPHKRLKVYGRYRVEEKLQNNTEQREATTPLGIMTREWYRVNFQYDLNKSFSLRNRIEHTRISLPNGEFEQGWMIYQDIVWKPKWPAKYFLKLRYALFDTDSYQSRIYAYEHDVLYSFSVPAYYQRGSRAYLVFGYDFTKWCDVSVRVAQTYYSDREKNGSGLNEIDGPTRTEVKVQFRLKF